MEKRTEEEASEQALSEILSYSRFLLKFTGYWPIGYEQKSKFGKFKSYAVAFFAGIITIFQCAMMFIYDQDVLTIIEDSLDAIGLILMTTRIFLFIIRRESTFSLAKKLGQLLTIEKIPEETEIMKTWHSRHGKMSKFLLRSYISLVSICIFGPLFTNEKHFPISATLPSYCYESSWFWMIYLIEMIACLYCCIGVLLIDTFVVFFLAHLCGELECLADRVKKFGSHKDPSLIPSSIKDHNIVIDFAEKTCDLFSVMLYVQNVFAMIAACISGFTAILMINVPITLKAIGIGLTLIVQVFIVSFIGETLSTLSTDIGEALSASKWHRCDTNDRRATQLILLRAQKPLGLSVGNFGVMNLRAFSDFISNTFSYLTILNTMIER